MYYDTLDTYLRADIHANIRIIDRFTHTTSIWLSTYLYLCLLKHTCVCVYLQRRRQNTILSIHVYIHAHHFKVDYSHIRENQHSGLK